MMSDTRRRVRSPIVLFAIVLFVFLGAGKWCYRPRDGLLEPQRELDTQPQPEPKPTSRWDESPSPHSLVTLPFRLMATTTAEIAAAHLVIQQVAASTKAATGLARARYQDVTNAYNSICRDRWEDMHYEGVNWTTRYQETSLRPEGGQWVPLGASDLSADEDDLFMTQIDVDAIFSDLHDLHRFVYHYISPNTDYVRMSTLFWGLSPETNAKVNKDLEDAAREPLHDHIADNFGTLAVLFKEEDGTVECEDKHHFISKYTSPQNTATDFENSESIETYFAKDPDVLKVEAGVVQSVYAVRCTIHPVKAGTGDRAKYPPNWMKAPV